MEKPVRDCGDYGGIITFGPVNISPLPLARRGSSRSTPPRLIGIHVSLRLAVTLRGGGVLGTSPGTGQVCPGGWRQGKPMPSGVR